MTTRKINRRSIERFQLGHSGDNGSNTRDRLTIPYLTPAGPWCVKYRSLTDEDPKYLYDPGVEPHLFNAEVLATADVVAITEGELDAISIEQAGRHAVAYPGADTWKRCNYWRWCFDSVSEVVVVADGDDVGRQAARGVAESLASVVAGDVRVVALRDGEDASSLLVSEGPIDLLDQLGLL